MVQTDPHDQPALGVLSTPSAVHAGLSFVDALDQTERSAFLGLFSGARFPWMSFNGGKPFIGKAECEWVDDWRDFYLVRLTGAGLFSFTEADPKLALGMKPGSTYVAIDCGPTELGFDVREAWWKRWRADVNPQPPTPIRRVR